VTVTASIIVPAYNESTTIADTIESLLALTGPDHEILIVDNGSTDDTRDVVREYAESHRHLTLLVEDEVQGSYAARNRGIDRATGEVLAFLDADETVDEDWLTVALGAVEDRGVDYLGCRVDLTPDEDTLVARYNAHTGFPVATYLERERYAPTCALLVRRAVFEDVGRFDGRLISGGDVEFGQRVHAAGYDQGYAADAVVRHPARSSLEPLVKKNVRVGRGFCQKQRYYPERYGSPGVPPKPSGSGSDERSEPDARRLRLAFTVLSLAMLACRGIGYCFEFLAGSRRDRER